MNTRAGPTPSDRPFPSLPSTKTNDAVITTTNVAQQLELGSEVPGGVDHLAGVVGEVVLGEFGQEAESAVEGAGGGLGPLGGVLGDVGGDVPVGDWAVTGEVGAADRPDVDLLTEPKHRRRRRLCGLGLPCPGPVLVLDPGALGGGANGVVEEPCGGPGGRGVKPRVLWRVS